MMDDDVMPEPTTKFEAWTARRLVEIRTDLHAIKDTIHTQNTNTWLLAGVLVTVALDVALRMVNI